MEIATNTKVCKKCNRELPISEFFKNKSAKDRLHCYCKECFAIYKKKRHREASIAIKLKEGGLSAFTSDELINELRKRGYRGTLRIVNETIL